jgi:hypothetical protein
MTLKILRQTLVGDLGMFSHTALAPDRLICSNFLKDRRYTMKVESLADGSLQISGTAKEFPIAMRY